MNAEPFFLILARSVKEQLAAKQRKLVLAESCTAGLVAAMLGAVPGISEWFCGSAVTYRETTKTEWLGVSEELITGHNVVSKEVAEAMAVGVLKITPEADISAAVTGHLGPTDDIERDGLIHIAIAERSGSQVEVINHQAERLDSFEAADKRILRQQEAAICVIDLLFQTLGR